MTDSTTKLSNADHAANVVTIVHTYLGVDATEIDDAGLTAIADAMRAVPAPSRGTVQSMALTTLFGMDDVNGALIGTVLTVWADLSAYATNATRMKVEKDPNVVAAEKVVALLSVVDAILVNANMDIDGILAVDGIDRDIVGKLTAAVRETVEKGGASRRHFTDTIADIVSAGALTAGTALIGRYGDAKATLTATGVKVNGKTFDNPSAAAATVVDHAVNGWDHWCVIVDGKKVALGSYRTA